MQEEWLKMRCCDDETRLSHNTASLEYCCFFQAWGRYQDRERLARFLAHSGIASRRHARAPIAAGHV